MAVVAGGGGPLPKESQAPPGALYSGLLECPCTTRIVKKADSYDIKSVQCEQALISDANECFENSAAVGFTISSNRTISDSRHVGGCFLSANTSDTFEAVFNTMLNSSSECVSTNNTGITTIEGRAESLVSVNVSADDLTDTVNITIQGPVKQWFAVGFDAEVMTDFPWTIVVSSGLSPEDPPVITERRLGDHEEGKLLQKNQVELLSSTVEGNIRTVLLTRSLEGIDQFRFNFSVPELASTQMDFISAVGSSPIFDGQKHKQSASSKMPFLATKGQLKNLDTCVCRGSTGTIGEKGGSTFVFNPQCMDEPLSDLKKTDNPTCDLNQYRGGLYCCKDTFCLLDEDQEIPPEEDEVRVFKSKYVVKSK